MIDAKIDNAVFTLLDDLMTKNRDAVEGYSKASANISELDMKETFIGYAKSREQFAGELKEEIDKLGGEFSRGSSLVSSVHRIWMELASAFVGKDSAFILKECLRGESAALADYQKASNNDFLPESSKQLIQKHHDYIESVIRNLKNKIAAFEASQS